MSVSLIAELSCNFMGDMKLAEDMIAAAAESGADYVKFQTWKVSNLQPGDWDHDGRRDVYSKSEISEDQHLRLKEMCESKGVKFLTSCFNATDLPFIRSITSEIKIPSPECPNRNLVNQAIQSFDRVYISTGASRFEEFRCYASYDNVCLLHCVSLYPCPSSKINMPRIRRLKAITPNVGYSGHYDGIWDAVAAITEGAVVIEKHFTTDRSHPYRDNRNAILPEQMRQIREFADEYGPMMEPAQYDFHPEEDIIRTQYAGRWGNG